MFYGEAGSRAVTPLHHDPHHSKYRSKDRYLLWWGWKESNLLPSGYEPPALTDELQPLVGIYVRFSFYPAG